MTTATLAPPQDDALARLTQAESALIGALDAGDVGGIERAVKDFSATLTAVRAVSSWSTTPETVSAVRLALRLIDAAAVRTNFLADQAGRRLDAILRARGDAPRIGYSRQAAAYTYA